MKTREQKLEDIVKAVIKARNAATKEKALWILHNLVEDALEELDELDPVFFNAKEFFN